MVPEVILSSEGRDNDTGLPSSGLALYCGSVSPDIFRDEYDCVYAVVTELAKGLCNIAAVVEGLSGTRDRLKGRGDNAGVDAAV